MIHGGRPGGMLFSFSDISFPEEGRGRGVEEVYTVAKADREIISYVVVDLYLIVVGAPLSLSHRKKMMSTRHLSRADKVKWSLGLR